MADLTTNDFYSMDGQSTGSGFVDPRKELQALKNKIAASAVENVAIPNDQSLSPENIVNRLAINVASQTPEVLAQQYNNSRENQIINNATGVVENNIAGLGSPAPILDNNFMNNYIAKSWEIESNNNPTAKNKKTGAYGYNQILPKYAQYYADKVNMTIPQSQTISGQRKMAETIYNDSNTFLKKNNFPINMRNLYLTHQQGRQGFKDLMNGKINEQALAQNIPTKFLMNAPEKESLRDTYLRYWDSKFN